MTCVPRIGQPVRIAECRFGQADLARPRGQFFGEFQFVAGDPFGQHDAGIVGGLNDDAVQQIVHADLAVEHGKHGGAVRRRAALAPGIFAHPVFVGEVDAALLELVEDVFGGHQLGEAGRIDQLVGVALEQHRAVIAVDQDRVRRGDRRLVLLGRLLLGRSFLRRRRGFFFRRRGKGDGAETDDQGRRHQPSSELNIPNGHAQRSCRPARAGAYQRRCGGKLRLSKGRGRS